MSGPHRFQSCDLTGQVFGKLTVLRQVGSQFRNTVWLCQCECGNTKAYRSNKLKEGMAKSCGCAAVKRRRAGKPPHEAERAVNYYIDGAQKRGLEWELTFEEAVILLQGECFYCGAAPSRLVKSYRKSQGDFLCNGIDRLDPALGYRKENCVSCCSACNYFKGNLAVDEFLNHIGRIAAHRRVQEVLP